MPKGLKKSIFYSWQSDADSALNRNFIEEVLKSALKKIGKDQEVAIDPVLDRDTAGLSGSPGISEAIFSKILRSDVFVADVSLVNASVSKILACSHRPTPNPNVLLELGFAANHLGWDRILMVMNSVNGGPEQLPFDLRGRRVLQYELATKDDRSRVRVEVRPAMEAALRGILKDSESGKVREPRWWGYWEESIDASHSGNLFIREIGARGFLFHIEIVYGARSGSINGLAEFDSPFSAHAVVPTDEGFGGPCVLTFRKTREEPQKILVEEEGSCHYFRGVGATFAGVYARKVELLFDYGFLDELDLARVYSITGQYYRDLMNRFLRVGKIENLDSFPAEVLHGGVAGLYSIMEGIIMKGSAGELWVAYIDGDVVRYFTTQAEYRSKLPQTIEQWRTGFAEKKVIMDPEVRTIPSTLI